MEAGGDEVSVVRLKPLEDLLVGKRFEGNEDGQQKQHPLIIADSWIGRPAMDNGSEDDADGRFGVLEDEGFYDRSGWDCDGCPPPYFDLPPPPRPPWLDDPDSCDEDNGNGVVNPYETCDNPVIVFRDLESGDLLNIILIVICSLVLVTVVIIVAVVIWRKRVCRLRGLGGGGGIGSDSDGRRSFRSKPTSSGDHISGPGATMTSSSSSYAGSPPNKPGFPVTLRSRIVAAEDIELSEHPSRHVYSNPNYPTLEIGGLPFYLMPATADAADSEIVTAGDSNFYEASSSSQRSGGPIYEDIDRMCTYRGRPPLPPPQQQQRPVRHVGGGGGLIGDERTYYNVIQPKSSSSARSSRPDSGGSSSGASPRHRNDNSGGGGGIGGGGGTSSSEVSFESGSSPRLPQQPQPNVVVNPMLSPRFRQTSDRPPRSPRPPPPPAAASPSSVYYYSDTLRPRARNNNNSMADSDSGISNNRSSEDTPPPLLPSQRMAAAMSMASASPKRRATTTSGGRKGSSSVKV